MPRTSSKDPAPENIPLRVGPYAIERKIARGGMATVLLGKSHEAGRAVALKVIRGYGAMDREHTVRFLREIQALAKLSHPYLVRILDAGFDGEWFYYAMEYMPGGTLRQILDQKATMEEGDALAIIRALGEATAYLHGKHVVHRDLKPSNVLLDRDGIPKVSDLGLLAIQEDTEITRTGQIMGTFRYMSPEMFEEGRVGHPSDVYQLGLLLFEMLAGRPLIVDDTPHRMVARILSASRPKVRQFNEGVEQHLEDFIHTCLDIDPKGRPRDARQFLEELDRAIRGDPRGGEPEGGSRDLESHGSHPVSPGGRPIFPGPTFSGRLHLPRELPSVEEETRIVFLEDESGGEPRKLLSPAEEPGAECDAGLEPGTDPVPAATGPDANADAASAQVPAPATGAGAISPIAPDHAGEELVPAPAPPEPPVRSSSPRIPPPPVADESSPVVPMVLAGILGGLILSGLALLSGSRSATGPVLEELNLRSVSRGAGPELTYTWRADRPLKARVFLRFLKADEAGLARREDGQLRSILPRIRLDEISPYALIQETPLVQEFQGSASVPPDAAGALVRVFHQGRPLGPWLTAFFPEAPPAAQATQGQGGP